MGEHVDDVSMYGADLSPFLLSRMPASIDKSLKLVVCWLVGWQPGEKIEADNWLYWISIQAGILLCGRKDWNKHLWMPPLRYYQSLYPRCMSNSQIYFEMDEFPIENSEKHSPINLMLPMQVLLLVIQNRCAIATVEIYKVRLHNVKQRPSNLNQLWRTAPRALAEWLRRMRVQSMVLWPGRHGFNSHHPPHTILAFFALPWVVWWS